MFRNDYSLLTTVSFSDKFEFFHFRNRRQDHFLRRSHIPRKSFLARDVHCATPLCRNVKAVLFLLSSRKISFQDRLLVCAGDGLPRRSVSGILSEDDKVVAIKHNFAEFSYLGGRLKHFQVIGGTNASTLWNKNVQREITRTIFEPHNIGVLGKNSPFRAIFKT